MTRRAGGARPPRPRIKRGGDEPPARAADLVVALWRRVPPNAWPAERSAGHAWAGLREALGRLAEQADALAGHRRTPAAERPAAQLLADTARAIDAALRGWPPQPAAAPDPRAGSRGALASPLRLRLARMERWLAARATADPGADAAADLCLWALEHLEADPE